MLNCCKKRDILLAASDPQLRAALERALTDQGFGYASTDKLGDALPRALEAKARVCVVCVEQREHSDAQRVTHHLVESAAVDRVVVITDVASRGAVFAEVDDQRLHVLARPFSMFEFLATVAPSR